MSEIENLAKGYAERVLSSANKRAEVDSVVRSASRLVYKATNEPASTYKKKEVLLYLLKFVIDDAIATKSADNASYLDLIAYILQQLPVVGR